MIDRGVEPQIGSGESIEVEIGSDESYYSAEDTNIDSLLSRDARLEITKDTQRALSASANYEQDPRDRLLSGIAEPGNDQSVRLGEGGAGQTCNSGYISLGIATRLLFVIAQRMHHRAEIAYKDDINNGVNISGQMARCGVSLQQYQNRFVERRSLTASKNDPDLRRLGTVFGSSALSDEELLSMLAPIESQSLEQTHENLNSLVEFVNDPVKGELKAALIVWERLMRKLNQCHMTKEDVKINEHSSSCDATRPTLDVLELASIACEALSILKTKESI